MSIWPLANSCHISIWTLFSTRFMICFKWFLTNKCEINLWYHMNYNVSIIPHLANRSYRLNIFRRRWCTFCRILFGRWLKFFEWEMESLFTINISIAFENYSALTAMIICIRFYMLLFLVKMPDLACSSNWKNWAVWLSVQRLILNDFIQPIPDDYNHLPSNECWKPQQQQK